MNIQTLFLTFFGTGKLPLPVLSATLAATAAGSAILSAMGAESLFTLAFAVFLIGVFEVGKSEKRTGLHDEPSVVIDEAAGVWLSLTVSSSAQAVAPDLPLLFPSVIFLGFFSFLLFRLWSPSTIGWIRKNIRGGLGVMLDDALAGFAAGIFNLLLFKAASALFAAYF
jgi:phosphatidylglycerophosphatase A